MRYISDTPCFKNFGRMKGYEMAKLSHLYDLPTVSTGPTKAVMEHFEVPAVDASMLKVDARLEEIVKDFPFSKSRLTDLAIAVSEAVNNAVNASRERTGSRVGIDILYIPEEMLHVYVTDESGRGFLIMVSFVSVLAYNPDATSDFKEIILGFEPDKC